MNTTKSAIENIYGLTPAQQGMLYHHLSDPNSGQYILQQTFTAKGLLPEDIVRHALALLSQRHDALRTAFVIPKASGKPRQILLSNRQAEFLTADLRGTPPDEQWQHLSHLETQDVTRGFNLERDPLLRLTLVRLSDNSSALILTAHHIILDGWSLPIIMRDFARYCTSLMHAQNIPALTAAATAENRSSIRYAHYISWLEAQDTELHLTYWQHLLDGYKTAADIAPLRKPSPTNTLVCVQGAALTEHDSRRLMSAAAAEGTTISTVLSTAWGLLLQRYNNTKDTVFGKVVSGRDIPLAGIETMAGLFINTLPVRVQTHAGQTVRSLLRQQQDQALTSDEHSHCALSDIQRLCSSGDDTQLFSTLFAFENYFAGETSHQNIGQVELSTRQGREQTNYPVSVRAFFDGRLHTDIMYNPQTYTDEDMRLLLRRYQTLLLSFAENTDILIGELAYLDNEENTQILHFSGAPTHLSPSLSPHPSPVSLPIFDPALSALSPEPAVSASSKDDSLSDLPHKTAVSVFADIAARYSHKTALHMDNTSMTYAALDEKSNRLAHTLRGLGVGPDNLVVLFTRRCFECIIGQLGILKAGGAYLPVDPDTPADRINFILKDSTPKILLSIGDAPVSMPEFPCLNLLEAETYAENSSFLTSVNKPEDLAYCIYTSGTTGQPKGVLLEHQGLVNLAAHAAEVLGLDAQDRVLQFTNYTFDVSIWEVFCALLNGASLVMIGQDIILDNTRFLEYIETQGVTAALLPPHYYRQSQLTGLKLLLTGGSAATPDIVERAAYGNAYWNAYGPTEITVASHFWKYEPGTPVPPRIPIGKPIPNAHNYILQGTHLCGAGIPGELCIGGAGLARGYLNRPELTQERFIDNPFGTGRLYRTGDLARWLPDGNVEYLGRMDDQVKVRGYRVELGEVESALRTLPDITDAVVVIRTDTQGASALHAYVTAAETLDTETLRTHLSHKLPSYMIPALFAQVETIPVNRSGKPDKSALPPLTPRTTLMKLPQNELETQALAIFQKTLGFTEMGIDHDFFEAGGDSIKAIQIASQLSTLPGLTVSVRDIFSLRTVERLVKENKASTAPHESGQADTSLSRPSTASAVTSLASHSDLLWQKLTKPLSDYTLQGSATSESPLTSTQYASVQAGILGSLGAVEISSPWDTARFLAAWNRLLAENPVLCREIHLDSTQGLTGRQRERTGTPETIPFLDLSPLAPNEQTAVLGQLSSRMSIPYTTTAAYSQDFLSAHSLLCAKTGPERFFVLMPVSHLVFDGFSNEVFGKRLRELYTAPDTAPSVRTFRPEEYEAFVRQGPEGVSDNDLVRLLALDNFRDCIETQRTAIQQASSSHTWSYGTFSLPVGTSPPLSPAALLSKGDDLCAKALRFAQPTGPLPFLLVTSARNYSGSNFSDSIGEFIDLAPVVWQDNESFAHARQRVLSAMRKHRINICALLYNEELKKQFPRTTGFLRNSLRLEQPEIQILNLLVLYGTQAIIPENPEATPDTPAPASSNRHAFLNVYAQNGSITIENIKYKTGQEQALRSQLQELY